ncbi:hypothetical protein [Streptomyces sp. H27-D2]|uniref:hypothetical protein n=1 Tax=Streptomyces sp. H27-D2 TaxID=3046304 RepID=UPI002DBCFACC|nr:hypothetical protein [Streptomyces sp. H27-D2]MEC4016491.1 hypothetical protein [Streptomyces sp. H27-D2]
MRKTADELNKQIRNLKAVAEVDAWDSGAGREFRKKAEGNVGKLEAAYKRYDAAADALGTRVGETGGGYQDKLHARSTNYASDLNRAQEIADAALKDAKDADERKGAAEKSLDGLSGKGERKSKKGHLEEKRDAADGEVEAAKAKIEAAKKIRDAAAKRAREAIDSVISGDSLKDGFWDSLVKTIADATSQIATVCGIAAMLVGWIPVIGQALAGVLGAIAMVATLVNLVCTLVQFSRGQADLMDLGFAALGFLMMGVGKAFGKIAGKFAGRALYRLRKAGGKPGVRTTAREFRRSEKKLNKIAGGSSKISMKDMLKSLREPFSDVLTLNGWKATLGSAKTLKPGAGNYKASWNEMRSRGGPVMGPLRSFSIADPSVASDLKGAKYAAQELSDIPAVNKIATRAMILTGTGTAVTGGGLSIDSNVNPLLS